jgi:arsenate reductase (thioredoxin)
MRRMRYLGLILAAAVAVASFAFAQGAPKSASTPPKTIVFLCEHGAAKSVIAAAYFNKLAAERHLPFHAIARGTNHQDELSTSAVAGLKKDGVAFPDDKPKLLSPEDAKKAVRVVAFCPVPDSLANKPVQKFDVPAPSDGYDKSRDEILKHVRELIDQLAATPAAK